MGSLKGPNHWENALKMEQVANKSSSLVKSDSNKW